MRLEEQAVGRGTKRESIRVLEMARELISNGRAQPEKFNLEFQAGKTHADVVEAVSRTKVTKWVDTETTAIMLSINLAKCVRSRTTNNELTAA